MKTSKLFVLLMLLSLSSIAQREVYSGMLGYGGVIYGANTYSSSHYGLSIRFAIEGLYFDISSNMADGYRNWINYSTTYWPMLPLNKYSQVNIWVANMGYMIPLNRAYLTPIIGYGRAQQFFEDPGYDTHYGIPIELLNLGLILDLRIGNHISLYGGISTIEIGKFGMAFNF